MRRKAVMFDLDGTLLDTLGDLADSMNQVLTDFSMPTHPDDAYRIFVGNGMENLAKRSAPENTDDATIKKMAQRMGEIYADKWNVKTRPYDGVEALLDELGRLGVALTILSNKPDHFTKLIVRHYFGDERFAAVFGQRVDVPKKPDPAAAFEIAGLVALPTESFLYLGDSDTDMRTGRAAGMLTVGVSWGFRSVEELVGAGAEHVIDRPEEALGFIRA